MKKELNITTSIPAYNAKENISSESKMQERFNVGLDEKTGESCYVGYDSKNQMKVTFLFQTASTIDTEKVIIDTLKNSFIERIKKEYLK